MSGAGYEVQRFEDGLAAHEALQQAAPDLLILDLHLPGMDGIDICRSLRQHHPRLPIMTLTARTEEIDVVLARRASAAAVHRFST
ncbi:MAG: response regulator [Candidatus Xenobia bacterium]